MDVLKCPNCHFELGNYLYADQCPHCHQELLHNTKRSVETPKRQAGAGRLWLVRWFMKCVRLVEA